VAVNGELPIDASGSPRVRRYQRVRIHVDANSQLELPSKWNVVQHDVGKLAEWLGRVNARLRCERAIGDIGDDADYCEPGVLVFSEVEPPSPVLAHGSCPSEKSPLGLASATLASSTLRFRSARVFQGVVT
jgi:hypothetical protein